MSEFEDKLGAILGNPDAMAQIMSLAQNLGGPASSDCTSPPPAPPSVPSQPMPDLSCLLSSFGEIDPQLIQRALQLFSEFSRSDDERVALLLALKPFLKEERYAKVDRAIQIARLSRVIRVALQLFKGKEESCV